MRIIGVARYVFIRQTSKFTSSLSTGKKKRKNKTAVERTDWLKKNRESLLKLFTLGALNAAFAWGEFVKSSSAL
jgi:hypothetical protein